MKLFISRDVSASDVCFVISDELGREKYIAVMKRRKKGVKGVAKNIVRLNILDENKNLVARLRQLPIAGVNSFSLKTEKSAVTLVIVLTNNIIQCRFYGNNWRILGNIASKNFSIVDVDNAQICNHIKRPLNSELEITDSSNELICLLAALCINMVNTVDKLAIQVV